MTADQQAIADAAWEAWPDHAYCRSPRAAFNAAIASALDQNGRLSEALAHTRYVIAAFCGERKYPWSALSDKRESAHTALSIIDDVVTDMTDIPPAISPQWLADEAEEAARTALETKP